MKRLLIAGLLVIGVLASLVAGSIARWDLALELSAPVLGSVVISD